MSKGKKKAVYYVGDPYETEEEDSPYGDEAGSSRSDAHIEKIPPQVLLREFKDINVAAPMVRYSKLAPRMLWASYNTHITYTPMMLAREFSLSPIARDADFTTSSRERGIFSQGGRKFRGCLIAQFAAKSGAEFADAVELIEKYVDGVDLNCGCPQPWAYKDEIGSYLLRQPHLVQDMIRSARARVGSDYPISIKIRIDAQPELTSQLVQTAIHAGVSYIGVHGRTRHQASSEPVNLEGIKFAREEAKGAVPIVGNGDIYSAKDAEVMREKTGVQGVMSARGMMENPALFAGYDKTPLEAVDRFLDIATATGLIFPLFHRHVSYMLEHLFESKAERIYFNSLASHASVMDFVDDFIDRRRAEGDHS